MESRRAQTTGIAGQDGSNLAELLLHKSDKVHGIERRTSFINSQCIDHLYQDPPIRDAQGFLQYGDLADTCNITRIVQQVRRMKFVTWLPRAVCW